ncbi:MAG: chalcone isomerase family protein [Sideroxydans sp.]|nr:chalcone isomerase family protein [Sideroxydans sp.]
MNKLSLGLCGLLLSWNVQAIEVAGVTPVPEVSVGATSLHLNGAGLRTKYFFKIYVAALYLPQKQKSGEAVIAEEVAHRIALHMLRTLDSDKLYGAFSEAIEANHSHDEMVAIAPQLKQMAQLFDAVKEVNKGDLITLDYQPSNGTTVSVNGVARGTIAGATFNRALLKVWLGTKPVQDDLKKGLLGG